VSINPTVIGDVGNSDSPLAKILKLPARPTVQVRIGQHGWQDIRDKFTSATNRAARRSAGLGWYHAHRGVKAYGRTSLYAPRGAWMVTRGCWQWFSDSDGRRALRATFESEDSFLKARDQHMTHVKFRAVASVVAGSVVGIGGALLWTQIPGVVHDPALMSLGVMSPFGLGVIGSPGDTAVVTEAALQGSRRIRVDDVVDALAITLPVIRRALDENPKAVRCLGTRERPKALSHFEIALPAGVTAGEVIAKRETLASALMRSVGCVVPSRHESGQANRLVLDILDREPAKREQGEWPLRKEEAISLFEPFPFGVDAVGDLVALDLTETNMLLAGQPGSGKSVGIKTLLASAALDPRSEIWCFEFKGSADYRLFEPVCTRYGFGAGDDNLRSALQALRELAVECHSRTQRLSELPIDVCPESKVTDEIASEIEELRPLVFVLDEAHRLFGHSEFGEEAGRLAADIIKLGRCAGIVLVVATQRPSKASIPTEVSSQFGTRLAFRLADHVTNDFALGSGMYRFGADATKIPHAAKGTGILVAGDEPQTLRVFMLDTETLQDVVSRALYMRGGEVAKSSTVLEEATRVLTERSILRDILSVRREDDKAGLWQDVIIERLRDELPDAYGADFDRPALRKAVRIASMGMDGEPVVKLKGINLGGPNRDGFRFDEIEKHLKLEGVR
jgi:S-DNA-T family DNA segregation ATPase FtsK/SpoIIIE